MGVKARLFAKHFAAFTPAMDTHDFAACVDLQAQTLRSFRPELLIGSSFGGAVALALLQRGLWRGPTLLLAQAAVRFGVPAQLPEDTRIWLVHGRCDELIDVAESRLLARTGSPGLVRLIEVDDDHALSGLAQSGRLVEIVRELAAASGLHAPA